MTLTDIANDLIQSWMDEGINVQIEFGPKTKLDLSDGRFQTEAVLMRTQRTNMYKVLRGSFSEDKVYTGAFLFRLDLSEMKPLSIEEEKITYDSFWIFKGRKRTVATNKKLTVSSTLHDLKEIIKRHEELKSFDVDWIEFEVIISETSESLWIKQGEKND